MIRRLYLLTGISCFLTILVHGQQIIVNSNGDKIIMYPDGSWRAVEAQDSLLLRQNLQKAEPILGRDAQSDMGNSRNKAEEQNFLVRQAQELKNLVLEEDKKVQDEFREATNAQFKAAELLHNAEANKNLIEPDHLLSLDQDYDKAVKALKAAKLKQKAIRRLGGDAITLADDPEKIRKKDIDQLKSKYNLFLTNYEHTAVPFSTNEKTYHAVTKSSSSRRENSASGLTAANSPPSSAKSTAESYSLLPPGDQVRNYTAAPYSCKIRIDTLDKEAKRRQVQVAPSLIFTHTDPDLRPYLKDKELITCKGSLLQIGPYMYLAVEFQIGSSHSQNNFGALQKDSLLRFKLLNGDYVSLYNIKSDRGHLDTYSGNTVFSGQYALGKQEIKKLNSSGLDKIRVMWATGFEDYDVYCIDFFKNQLNCLKGAN